MKLIVAGIEMIGRWVALVVEEVASAFRSAWEFTLCVVPPELVLVLAVLGSLLLLLMALFPSPAH